MNQTLKQLDDKQLEFLKDGLLSISIHNFQTSLEFLIRDNSSLFPLALSTVPEEEILAILELDSCELCGITFELADKCNFEGMSCCETCYDQNQAEEEEY